MKLHHLTMKSLKIKVFNDGGEQFIESTACHIDIVDSHSVVYLPLNQESHVKDVIRLFWYVESVNIVRGTITVYFTNHNYLIITND